MRSLPQRMLLYCIQLLDRYSNLQYPHRVSEHARSECIWELPEEVGGQEAP